MYPRRQRTATRLLEIFFLAQQLSQLKKKLKSNSTSHKSECICSKFYKVHLALFGPMSASGRLAVRHRVWVEANSEKAAELFMLAATQARVCTRPSAPGQCCLRSEPCGHAPASSWAVSPVDFAQLLPRKRRMVAGAGACVPPEHHML